MNVYAFYRQIPGLWEEETQRELIKLWAQSWKKNGWNPILFEEEDLQALDNFKKIKEKVDSLPTMWGKDYALACMARWLLASKSGGGLLSDYDVINYSFRPPRSLPAKMTILCSPPPASIAMGAVLGTMQHFRWTFELLMSYKFDPERDVYDGKPHCSEFAWFARMFEYKNLYKPSWIVRAPGCVNFTAPGWRTAPLVHYGFEMHQVDLWPKYKYIPLLRN